MLRLKAVLTGAALLASTALCTPANALPITITGEDNFGNIVTNSAPSPVNFGPTSVGQWSATGSAQGTPPAPLGTLFSNTIAFATTGAGSFTLWITETGLTFPLGTIPFLSTLTSNGLTGGVTSADLTTLIQSDNSIPGPTVPNGDLLTSHSFTDLGTFKETDNGITGAGPYSLTERYDITATGVGGADLTIILAAPQAVPEPGSLILMCSGLFGLLGVLKFTRRRGGSPAPA
jgi:hypothetical protein